ARKGVPENGRNGCAKPCGHTLLAGTILASQIPTIAFPSRDENARTSVRPSQTMRRRVPGREVSHARDKGKVSFLRDRSEAGRACRLWQGNQVPQVRGGDPRASA